MTNYDELIVLATIQLSHSVKYLDKMMSKAQDWVEENISPYNGKQDEYIQDNDAMAHASKCLRQNNVIEIAKRPKAFLLYDLLQGAADNMSAAMYLASCFGWELEEIPISIVSGSSEED